MGWVSDDVALASLVVLLGLTLAVLLRLHNTPERIQALANAQQAYDAARHGWAHDLAVYEQRFRRLEAAKAWVLLPSIAFALAVVFLTDL
jgi:hypothetical protein